MSSLHRVFQDSRLEILVPSERLRLPFIDTSSFTWWSDFHKVSQRTLAFFDETLYVLLVLRLSEDPDILFALLQRLQVALETAYISPFVPSTQPGRKPPPPNVSSLGVRARSNNAFFPPMTPNPIPATSTPDHPYANADSNVNLQTATWGEKDGNPEDSFIVAWSEQEKAWVVIYELTISVSFLQSRVSEPLLCLTALITLRDTILPDTPQRSLFAEKLTQAGIKVLAPELKRSDESDEGDAIMQGMSESNLLESLNGGVTFNSETSPLSLTSARLGPSVRRQAFSISPFVSHGDAEDAPSPKTILRKSFRKTLRAVEGIKVRMRNCFVPYSPAHIQGEVDYVGEQGIGTHERTIILSVEIENSEESGIGFQIEKVDVEVSGERSITRFIGWGSNKTREPPPITLISNNQVNLLYTVALESPSSISGQHPPRRFSVNSQTFEEDPDDPNKPRHVSITVAGHPFTHDANGEPSSHLSTFSSKWNCLLDLKASQLADPSTWYNRPASPLTMQDVLPTPASPYTGSFSRDVGVIVPNYRIKSFTSGSRPQSVQAPINRSSVGTLQQVQNGSKFVPSPPSAVMASFNLNVASMETTEERSDRARTMAINHMPSRHPLTPAFPAFQGLPPPSPFPQSPAGISFPEGLSLVENRRYTNPAIHLPGTGNDAALNSGREMAHNLLVSVTLLPPESPLNPKAPKLIYPHDVFSLEILVLNLSDELRRCEVGYLHANRRRMANRTSTSTSIPVSTPTQCLMSLDNNIRVGPLLPGTCQSVRMHILALEPGVHMIDSLTLTDVMHRYTVRLRSVMNVVVEHPYSTFV